MLSPAFYHPFAVFSYSPFPKVTAQERCVPVVHRWGQCGYVIGQWHIITYRVNYLSVARGGLPDELISCRAGG